MDETIVGVLMRRDGMSQADALAVLWQARRDVVEGKDPETVLADDFGLEPDYAGELI